MPLGVPIPPSPAGVGRRCSPRSPSAASTGTRTRSCARSTRRARWRSLADGDELPYDLFLGVPVHRVPEVVEASGLTVDGWIPVDPLTLETSFPGVYAVGDVTSVGTPKAGVFAEGQAAVVADAIIARVRGDGDAGQLRRHAASATSSSATTRSAKVEVTFLSGQRAERRVRRPVGGARRRQGRVRHQPHPPLVRPRVEQRLTTKGSTHDPVAGEARGDRLRRARDRARLGVERVRRARVPRAPRRRASAATSRRPASRAPTPTCRRRSSPEQGERPLGGGRRRRRLGGGVEAQDGAARRPRPGGAPRRHGRRGHRRRRPLPDRDAHVDRRGRHLRRRVPRLQQLVARLLRGRSQAALPGRARPVAGPGGRDHRDAPRRRATSAPRR